MAEERAPANDRGPGFRLTTLRRKLAVFLSAMVLNFVLCLLLYSVLQQIKLPEQSFLKWLPSWWSEAIVMALWIALSFYLAVPIFGFHRKKDY